MGEGAGLSVKHLLDKYRDWSSDPQNPHKMLGGLETGDPQSKLASETGHIIELQV